MEQKGLFWVLWEKFSRTLKTLLSVKQIGLDVKRES